MRHLILVAVCVSLLALTGVSSQEENPSIEQFSKTVDEDYEKALDLLDQEHPDVQQAMPLLEKSGGNGNSEAYLELAMLFEYGVKDVLERDYSRAMQYHNLSADLGNEVSLYELGFMWSTGKGVVKNTPLSLVYYAFSAQAGDMLAELALGYRYLYGLGLSKSCQRAILKYESAAQKVVELVQRDQLSSSFMDASLEPLRLSETSEAPESREKEEDEVVQYYRYTADTGDVQAQVTMGTLHLQGTFGVGQDYTEAHRYFQQAAEQGDLAGMTNLGYLHAQGYGTEQDNATAIKLYYEAAMKGHPQAQNNLGYMYLNGFGVDKNAEEAAKWFARAANQGHAEAAVNLGTLYYSGEGVPQEYGKAINYFTVAAHSGHVLALYNLASMQQHGLGTIASCTNAVALYKRVAEKGDWTLGMDDAYASYHQGDHSLALLLFEQMAEEGLEVAQYNAAWMYDRGLGVKEVVDESEEATTHNPRYQRALHYLSLSAEQKNPASMLRLGDYYYYGLGTHKAPEKAALYYQAASELRNAQAMFNLGYMHQHGIGLPSDLHLAKRYYDMTLETDPHSALAVYLALLSLLYQFVVNFILRRPSASSTSLFASPTGRSGRTSLSPSLTSIITPSASKPVNGSDWDGWLLLLLFALLVIAVVLRQRLQRRMRLRHHHQQQQQQQQQQPAPAL